MSRNPKKKTGYQAEKQLRAIRKTKVYEEIAEQIMAQIEDGTLKPGHRLPPERRLAEIFKVSRHSVREAIRTLEEKNVLQSRIGSGTYVVMEDHSVVADFLTQALNSEEGSVEEVFQFRRMMEPRIAALAALNRTPGDLDKMKELLVLHQQAGEDINQIIHLDRRYHMALAKATGNKVIHRVAERVNDIVELSRRHDRQPRARARDSLTGHRQIYDRIENQDPPGAEKAMENHLAQMAQLAGRQE